MSGRMATGKWRVVPMSQFCTKKQSDAAFKLIYDAQGHGVVGIPDSLGYATYDEWIAAVRKAIEADRLANIACDRWCEETERQQMTANRRASFMNEPLPYPNVSF